MKESDFSDQHNGNSKKKIPDLMKLWFKEIRIKFCLGAFFHFSSDSDSEQILQHKNSKIGDEVKSQNKIELTDYFKFQTVDETKSLARMFRCEYDQDEIRFSYFLMQKGFNLILIERDIPEYIFISYGGYLWNNFFFSRVPHSHSPFTKIARGPV